ncbi:MAG TPA: hypothetical protein VN649_05860 [Ramlibacter sp.]|nr:hypothetical protein [Ramlibacter sp.]
MAPRDNTKKTGDTHPPDVELEPPFQERMTDAMGTDATPRERGRAADATGDSSGRTSRESDEAKGGDKR